jgi:hypothetical protein
MFNNSLEEDRKMARWLALLFSAFCICAFAQDNYPSRPVKFILPFPPGGGTDILGRVIGERLSREPRAAGGDREPRRRGRKRRRGGGGASAPDGYTIVLVAPSLAISPSLYSKLNYDPVKDLAPISLVATVPNVMITNPSGRGEEPAGIHRAGALAAGRHELRLRRRRHLESPRRRALQHRDGRESSSTSL